MIETRKISENQLNFKLLKDNILAMTLKNKKKLQQVALTKLNLGNKLLLSWHFIYFYTDFFITNRMIGY